MRPIAEAHTKIDDRLRSLSPVRGAFVCLGPPQALPRHEGGTMSTTFSLRDIDVVLRDGSSVRIRPAHATDEPGILAFLQSLSDDSRRLRFPAGNRSRR